MHSHAGPLTVIPSWFGRACKGIQFLTLPEGVTTIEANAFQGRPLRVIRLPSTLRTIGPLAFSGCTLLTEFDPRGIDGTGKTRLELVGPAAFRSCTTLDYARLPLTVSALPPELFAGCRELGSVRIEDAAAAVDPTAFNGCSHVQIWRGPEREDEDYVEASAFGADILAPPSHRWYE